MVYVKTVSFKKLSAVRTQNVHRSLDLHLSWQESKAGRGPVICAKSTVIFFGEPKLELGACVCQTCELST